MSTKGEKWNFEGTYVKNGGKLYSQGNSKSVIVIEAGFCSGKMKKSKRK
jgi:hypothetical protein